MPDFFSLVDEYAELAASDTPQARGSAFEGLVARLFEQARFKADVNPHSARPRQTDLLTTSGRDVYLVETKWTRAKANVGDVDSLFRRLEDTPASVCGVLISVSGFTKTAVARVEAQRARPVLLVDGEELEGLLHDPGEVGPACTQAASPTCTGADGVRRSRPEPPRHGSGRVGARFRLAGREADSVVGVWRRLRSVRLRTRPPRHRLGLWGQRRRRPRHPARAAKRGGLDRSPRRAGRDRLRL